MSQEGTTTPDPRDALKLKLPEPDVDTGQPWADDVLDRTQIAARLTNLIRNQSAPFVISIHGYWGTGKTFMLRRWQKDLENQNYRAIYFNAWEDDFCDDPLIAILGQLSEYFQEGTLKSLADKVAEAAVPLFWQNVRGVVEKYTGTTWVLEQSKDTQKDPLKSYLSQRSTKEELKKRLKDMSAKVREETGHPMVFIIDELDRCRPTFAIELLERVKHIFDVPNMVFVFGINRDELCTSLRSIYGKIDADTYLRRFFDMEFTLPEVDSEKFGRHLMQKFGLGEFFDVLSQNANSQMHTKEFGMLGDYLDTLWSHLDLSLRDIDYCVRSIALVGRNLELRHRMHPWLLGLLITLKLKNSNLYRQFIHGNCLGSDVVNYISEITPLQKMDSRSIRVLDAMEASMYLTEVRRGDLPSQIPTALSQLKLLENGESLTRPEYLSKRTGEQGAAGVSEWIKIMQSQPDLMFPANVISDMANLIDLHQDMVRR